MAVFKKERKGKKNLFSLHKPPLVWEKPPVSPLGVFITQQNLEWVIDVIKVIGKERLGSQGADESAESLSNEIMFQGVLK